MSGTELGARYGYDWTRGKAQGGRTCRVRGGRSGCGSGSADSGCNGFASEYGLGALLASARVGRVAPVSHEMVLNFVAQFSVGPPKSY